MENNIKLEVTGNTLVIREGHALPLHEPQIISIDGTIDAPSRFLSAKEASLTAIETTLYVDQNEGSLKLICDEKSHYSSRIKGLLKKSKALKEIGVNDEKKFYSDKELAKFINSHIFYFEDKVKAISLQKQLLKFTAKINQDIQNHADLKGNLKLAYDRAVTTDLPDTIAFKVSVFEGLPKEVFVANIGIEVDVNTLKFYFDSPQLYELEETIKEEILTEEIAKFDTFGCAVIFI